MNKALQDKLDLIGNNIEALSAHVGQLYLKIDTALDVLERGHNIHAHAARAKDIAARHNQWLMEHIAKRAQRMKDLRAQIVEQQRFIDAITARHQCDCFSCAFHEAVHDFHAAKIIELQKELQNLHKEDEHA